ncbi:MAG: Eco29kI family restriction endonuclease [Candidatus Tectomicrobia bacterium]|nr:Eco29kI family restriction endonuclease [Candidatus Tectomicrobia bacterium]
MDYPLCELPPSQSFMGCGVYTIHYQGEFPSYSGMSDVEPIYVGKADPPGKRQGRGSVNPEGVKSLYRRIRKHAASIQNAENLELRDFFCRWLVLDPVWIGLTEQVLIAEYQPIWNNVVDGFGDNAPGRGRANQRRSPWDTLHPGRRWAANLPPNNNTAGSILESVAAHRSRP